ncbi:CND1-like protein [Mya arenaria]|uniref:Condensin complex subunit 1 n=1 Tax=Mya arenaria TaxID=6604 RepID=A0ABY7F162_MYAAR|nr:CND1-like protein [Mya arenaria]
MSANIPTSADPASIPAITSMFAFALASSKPHTRISMEFEFPIPVSRDDLLNKTGVNQYVVDEVLSPREIAGAVQVAASLSTKLPGVLEGEMDPGTRRLNLNLVKMTCYLMCQYMEMFESDETKPSTQQNRKKKKSSTMTMDWQRERETGLKSLLNLVQLSIHRLWDPPVVEEEFVSLVTNCCYKMLENPEMTHAVNKDTRDAICHIIGVMVKRYNHGLGASLKIIQLLQHFEHLVSPLATAVSVCVQDYSYKSIVAELIREIGRMDGSDLARDSSGTRAYSVFLVEMTEKCPAAVLPNISLLLGHLDGESYMMRNGVLAAMGEILIRTLSKEGLDDKMKDTRDQFLEHLEDHLHDVHAYVRSKVLQIWFQIVEQKCLPLPHQENLLKLVIGRLEDKSSQVRKYAIQLITTLLKNNPFAAKLSPEELEVSYQKEVEKLHEMAPDDEEEDRHDAFKAEAEAEWLALETELRPLIEEQEEEEENRGSPVSLVSEQDTEDRESFPEIGQEKPTEESENVAEKTRDDDDDDEMEEDEESGKKDSPETSVDLLTCLKNIFMEKKHASHALSAAEGLESQKDPIVAQEVAKQQVLVLYLKESLAFATQLQNAVPVITLLLGSKNITDVLEAIEFFVTGLNAQAIVKNLSALTMGATLCDVTSLEGLMKGDVGSEPYRLPETHEMFTSLSRILVKSAPDLENRYWIPLMEQAVNVIYKLAECPDQICGDLIKKLCTEGSVQTESVLEKDGGTEDNMEEGNPLDTLEKDQEESSASFASGVLSRLLSLVGHVALRQLVHLDLAVFGEMKRRRAIQEQKEWIQTPASKRPKDSTNQETIEEEMGLAGAAAEDAESEYIRKICETEVVTGNTLLSAFGPLLAAICSNQQKYPDPELQTAATLALAKFMMVSSEFCDGHLQLLFTMLEKSTSPIIRANTIVAMGDLCFRFPNLIEPWTPHLYARLRDESSEVRKNTMQVLTHLILNDMIKVKGQISEMAICIVDGNERIASLAKLFFNELAKKGNAVYNIMPDMISRLSDPDVGIDEENFRTIMKVDRQWRDLSFCLSMLSFSEKSIAKLHENFLCFADKLADEEVYSCFSTIVTKSRSFAKQEAKKGLNEDELMECAGASPIAKKVKTPRRPAKTPAKGKAKKGGRRRVDSSDEELDAENLTPVPRTQKTRGAKKKTARPTFSDSDDSDIELFEVDKSSKKKKGELGRLVLIGIGARDPQGVEEFVQPVGHRPQLKTDFVTEHVCVEVKQLEVAPRQCIVDL